MSKHMSAQRRFATAALKLLQLGQNTCDGQRARSRLWENKRTGEIPRRSGLQIEKTQPEATTGSLHCRTELMEGLHSSDSNASFH